MATTATTYPYSTSAFGSQVGQVPMPDPYSDLSSVYPNLSGTNQKVSSNIMQELSGQLSPDVLNQIQNSAASWGVASGMPGSGLQLNKSLANVGLTSMQEQQQGIKDYNSTIPTISSTQTVAPATQAEINLQNAVSAAAPVPSEAASYAQQLFQQYMNQMNPAGGSSYSMNMPSNVYSQFPSQGGGTSSAGNYANLVNSNLDYQNPYQVYSTGGYGQDNVDMSGFGGD